MPLRDVARSHGQGRNGRQRHFIRGDRQCWWRRARCTRTRSKLHRDRKKSRKSRTRRRLGGRDHGVANRPRFCQKQDPIATRDERNPACSVQACPHPAPEDPVNKPLLVRSRSTACAAASDTVSVLAFPRAFPLPLGRCPLCTTKTFAPGSVAPRQRCSPLPPGRLGAHTHVRDPPLSCWVGTLVLYHATGFPVLDQHCSDPDRRALLDFNFSSGVWCSATSFPATSDLWCC